jgi:hypothetical protein
MGARIRIFGVNFVAPKGLRKSPGTNSHASCVANELYGKKGGGRAGVRSRFVAASKTCKGK